ncbi:MAG: YtxH domain-containing protein [Chitinophagaceae bacterium]|nr:MAG: YtxH domain-containing protein [Chitinophagaceae bacterium]
MEKGNGKVLFALLAGAAVGTAMGLLFAPNSGKDTRKQVSESFKDLNEKLTKETEQITQKAKELLNKSEETLNKVKAKAKEAV